MPSRSDLERAISAASDALFKFRANDVTAVCVGTAAELAAAAVQAAGTGFDANAAALYAALADARAALADPSRKNDAAVMQRIDEILAARPKE